MSDLEILYVSFRRGLSVFLNVALVGALVLLLGMVLMLKQHYDECQVDKRDHTNFVSNCGGN